MKGITITIFIILFITFWSGWVKNVIKLTDCDFEAPYKTEAIRAVGLVPPIGAIIGWMDIGEENE